MPHDPTTAATTTASRPIFPLPQHQPHPHRPQHHRYSSPQQQQHLPIRAPNPSPLAKPHDPSHHFLYPFASSGRGGFVPKGVGPIAADHAVTGYPPPSVMYPHGVRGMHLDYLSHAMHVTRPLHHVQFPHLGHASPPPAAASPSIKGHPKVNARSAVSDVNGFKDTSTRERSGDDTFIVVRDRKVRITDDASLYALCRSWLRNGIHEESQPQQTDVMKVLPKPLPASMVAGYLSNKQDDEKDEDEQEQNEKSVEHLSPQDLLKRHVKRAKRVRARLREERLQRITRYRNRLRLLLPPPVEQFRNDTPAGY